MQIYNLHEPQDTLFSRKSIVRDGPHNLYEQKQNAYETGK